MKTRYFIFGVGAGLLFYYLFLFFSPSSYAIFSPGAESKIIDLIDSANNEIYIEMYVFSSDKVISSLISAKKRGVEVKIIMENDILGNGNAASYKKLTNAGIEVRWASDSFKLTHSKFMIIDRKHVLVGSHNFSESALNFNREASVVVSDLSVINSFIDVFIQDWIDSA